MTIQFPTNLEWTTILQPVLDSPETIALFQRIDEKYNTEIVLPAKANLFKAFELTDYSNTKVVIIGQDPYPDPDHAMGLSFSIPNGEVISKSLRNIFNERRSDVGILPTQTQFRDNGDLSSWARQGVLLLNSTLTVQANKRNSHAKLGWDNAFTNFVIDAINKKDQPVVFVLWGAHANAYTERITNPHHCIIQSSHPSPLGARKTTMPFIGSKVFSRTNDFLIKTKQDPIDWAN